MTTTVCAACNVSGPARLRPGELCSACQARDAWSTLAELDRVVIDRRSIDEAMRRRAGEAAGEPWWRRWLVVAPPIVTLGAALLAGRLVLALRSARRIGPLDTLLADLSSSSERTTLVGLATVVVALIALVRLRRQRHFRRLPLIASHGLAIVIGATALVVGGFHWWAMGAGFNGRYTSMPAREPMSVTAAMERVVNATVVILAPDRDGDARNLTIGTGAIVAADDGRAWIVTCSHVAMPYVAVGVRRRARDAHAVWVQLSDGREGQARVRWTAPPPLDVALLEMPIAHPPEPVAIAPDASSVQPASSVSFVPNPYRAGWKVRYGQLIRRETHRTPAGAYDLLYTDLPVVPGDSGSGLYDERGQLVGLNTWTQLAEGSAHGISLPSETMRVLVDSIQHDSLDQIDEPAPPRE